MLWIVLVIFGLAGVVYNPIYIELCYFEHRLSLNWLPRVFSGHGSPIAIPHTKTQARHKRTPKALLSRLFKRATEAFYVESISLSGLFPQSPPLEALTFGGLQAIAGIWGAYRLFYRTEVSLHPFDESPGAPSLRMVFSLCIYDLLRRSLRRRFVQ